MKIKSLLIVVLVFITSIVFAQDEKNAELLENRNELKLNMVYMLAGMPEFTYERILNRDSAIGISAAVALVEDPFYDFAITPYYRLYFGKKVASGFFIELNGSFYSETDTYDEDYVYIEDEFGGGYYTYVNDSNGESELGLGLGVAIGTKLMLKRGWFGEVFGGAGRNFLNTKDISSVYPRGGITIGKRF